MYCIDFEPSDQMLQKFNYKLTDNTDIETIVVDEVIALLNIEQA